MTTLISFSTRSVSILTDIYNGSNQNNKIFYPSLPYSKSADEADRLSAFLTLNVIIPNYEGAIEKWLEVFDDINPTLSLLVLVKSKAHRFADGEFLSLAQAVESLHRRTSNEKPMETEVYKAVLKEIYNKCGPEH